MATPITIARPYAKAVMLQAQAGSLQKTKDWSKSLQLLAEVVEQPKIARFLKSPFFSEKQKAEQILGITKEALIAPAEKLLLVLAEHKRLACLPAIKQLFEAMKSRLEKSRNAEVIFAIPPKDEDLKLIHQKLESRYKSQITVVTTIDKKILGGFIVRMENHVIDYSLRNRIQQLAGNLLERS